ncbi:MAG: glycoside hydrolase family 3 N-terminal domain-containing protein [Hyphomicrobiaceae bacterium]|nr:glycoside hydrolase family 3 N-terminal domain-containing protein [Hyphomicrobiaceae bacterium]
MSIATTSTRPVLAHRVAAALALSAGVILGAGAAIAAAPQPDIATLSYQDLKALVLSHPPETLRRLGSHFIVGYHARGDLKPLLERGALGGVFVTARNVKRGNARQLAADIAGFRALHEPMALRPLFIAADQEGGVVSRLSPPLKRQPALARVVAAARSADALDEAISAYAAAQGEGLARLGVNLNFAPVIDLKPRGRRRDGHTRLMQRAIAEDPEVVETVAGRYCEGLMDAGVLCTLKHFPGLRFVTTDTHARPAIVEAGRDRLEGKDWVPFRNLLATGEPALMIGHPRLVDVDPDKPATLSQKVIGGIVRRDWAHDGLVISDDLYMGAIRHAPGGLTAAAIDALNAGTDLLLVEHMGRHILEMLHALVTAEKDGRLNVRLLAESQARLDRIAARFATAPFADGEPRPVPAVALPERRARVE